MEWFKPFKYLTSLSFRSQLYNQKGYEKLNSVLQNKVLCEPQKYQNYFISVLKRILIKRQLYVLLESIQTFRPGLTEEAKRLILERDQTRKKISKTDCYEEKSALKAKYRQIRNKTISPI